MDIENLEIIVGTYEEFLLGYRVVQQENGVIFSTISIIISLRLINKPKRFAVDKPHFPF